MNQISAQAQFVRCDSVQSSETLVDVPSPSARQAQHERGELAQDERVFEDAPDGLRVGPVPLHHPADGPADAARPLRVPRNGEDWRSREPVLTPSRKLRFLDELSRHGNVRVAAGRVGVSRSAVYLAQRRDAAFASGWRAALVRARDHAEAVLAERALEGVEEQVFYRGELVGSRRRYDSRLLLAHLARLDRLCAEDARAVDDAARFDAVIGEVGDLAQAAEHHPETGAPLTWPPRADFVAEARADACAEARSFVSHGKGADRWSEEKFDREAVDAAVAEAGAEWDAFHGQLYRAVDAVLDAGGGAPSASAPEDQGRGGVFVQDCVQCVQSIDPFAAPSDDPTGDSSTTADQPRAPSRQPRAPSRHPRAGGDPSNLAASGMAAMDSRLRGNDEGRGGVSFGEGRV